MRAFMLHAKLAEFTWLYRLAEGQGGTLCISCVCVCVCVGMTWQCFSKVEGSPTSSCSGVADQPSGVCEDSALIWQCLIKAGGGHSPVYGLADCQGGTCMSVVFLGNTCCVGINKL